MAGEWSTPDLSAALSLAVANRDIEDRPKLFRTPQFALRLQHALNRNTRRGSRRNISAHYDLGNDFYERWLDAGMNYSSALYSASTQELESAQNAKLDRVIALLQPQPGDKVLEIGCGWGAFAERLLRKHDCSLTGLTLSTEQLRFAQQRLTRETTEGRCDLRLQDYRDIAGSFDRIVSIEMLEAVGEAYWPTYFQKLHELLRPGGVAVLQVITIADDRFDAYRRKPDFIQKHIFPGGMLPTTGIIERVANAANLTLTKAEFFGDSYARTLSDWNARFQSAWPDIQMIGYDERFKRMWEYYLAYCEVGFATRALDVGFYTFERRAA